jgi:hypothetical protein
LKTILPLLFTAAALASPAAAQRLSDDVIIQVSGYFPKVNSGLRINGSGGQIGTDIDLEKDLGFERSNTLPAFLVEWRPDDRWVLTGQYYSLGRRSTARIDRDFIVGNTTYPVNTQLAAGFDSNIYRFTVGYRFYRSEKVHVAAALGFHGTDFNVFLEGQGAAAGQPIQFRTENRSVFAPLPTIGLSVAAEPLPRVYVGARVDWLSLSIDGYNGRLWNTEANVAYRVFRNVDIGASWRFVDYRLRVNRPNWNGQATYNFSGPSVFLQIGF